MRSMITAANTLSQLQQQVDVISNNIANVDTNGYKKKVATFNELLVQQFNNQPKTEYEIGRNTPLQGIRYGVGSYIGDISTTFTQGSFKETGRDLDFAFTSPNHFLEVTVVKNGQTSTAYTRDGALQLSAVNGNPNVMQVTTSEGHGVNDANGNPIFVPAGASKVRVTDSGNLEITGTQGQVVQNIPLGIVAVNKPQILESAGANLYQVSENNGANIGQDIIRTAGVEVRSGSLEASNVDMSEEMGQLILSQRHYQAASRTISLSDQMLGLINGIR